MDLSSVPLRQDPPGSERQAARRRVALARRREKAIFRGAVLLEQIDAIQTDPLPSITAEA